MSESSDAVLTPREISVVADAMRGCGEPVGERLSADMIAGGRSNLTYRLDDGERRWVLRTPPRVGRTPSAHDIAREFRVTSALEPAGVPVPRAVVSGDSEQLGGPFAVWEFVDASCVRTQSELAAIDESAVTPIVRDMIDTLAGMHRVDLRACGLESFGKPYGYAARQLKRWAGQWELVGSPKLDSVSGAVISALVDHLPQQCAVAVVHGDFRIDNVLIDIPSARVAAVVDWELSTIGDPVADVAMMCAYRDPVLDLILGSPSAWTDDRLPGVDDLAGWYAAAGGAELRDWDLHLALAYFKIGVIAAGIDHRFRAGGSSGPGYESAGESVARYFELAHERLSATRSRYS